MDEVEAFKENLAAKRIQRGWLDHKQQKYNEELDDVSASFSLEIRL